MIQSGIIANAALAARDSVRSVKREAIEFLGNLLVNLGSHHEHTVIRELMLSYELFTILLDILRNDW